MKKLTKYQAFWPAAILLAILLLNGLISKGEFFRITIVDGHFYGRLIDILRNGSTLMLLATGMTMVLATAGTDISVGAVMAVSSSLACSIVESRILPGFGGSLTLSLIIGLLAGCVCGLWNGFLVAKVKIQPIVATLILMVAGRGIAQLIADGKIVTTNSAGYYYLYGGYILGIPFSLFIVAFFVTAALLFTKKTAFGMFVEATGCNAEASRLTGIKVARLKLLIYAFCGFMAATAGLVESASIKGADANNIGLMIELDGILAVAIGGTAITGGRFSIPASILGALIIQSITTSLLSLGVAPQAIKVAKAVIVIAICLAQSDRMREQLRRLAQKLRPSEKEAEHV
jgi:simple sugar transport system permease protein